MKELTKLRIEQAKENFLRFACPNLKAACVTGSVAKDYTDETSDIDCLLFYERKFTQEEFDKVVSDARESGGDLHNGNPEEGFALFFKLNGVICDFAFIQCSDTEEMFRQTVEKPEASPMVHLQISGIIDSIDLYGGEWIESLRQIARSYPRSLQELVVKNHIRFHPKWVLNKMGYEREDLLFIHETIAFDVANMAGILCGINKVYLPGKLKGLDHTLEKMKIKPANFIERYRNVYKLHGAEAADELYDLIEETILLAEKYVPEVSTERTRRIINMPFGA